MEQYREGPLYILYSMGRDLASSLKLEQFADLLGSRHCTRHVLIYQLVEEGGVEIFL